MIMWRVLRTIS